MYVPEFTEFTLVNEVRRKLALSQEDLDRKLSVSYNIVNHWKKGLSKPSKLAWAQLDAFCERMRKADRLDRSEL